MPVLVLLVVPVWLPWSRRWSPKGPQAAPALRDAASMRARSQSIVDAWLWLRRRIVRRLWRTIELHDRGVAGRPETRWYPLAAASGPDPRRPGAGRSSSCSSLWLALFFFLRDGEPSPAGFSSLLPFGEAGQQRAGTGASGGSDLRQRDRVGWRWRRSRDRSRRTAPSGVARPARAGRLGHRHGVLPRWIPRGSGRVIWFPVAVWLMATGEMTRGLIPATGDRSRQPERPIQRVAARCR